MRLEPLKVLSTQEAEKIHKASLRILENTGFSVASAEALDAFEAGGATVDREKHLVKIPAAITEKALKTAPKRFMLYNRDGSEAFMIGNRVPRCASGHNAVFVIDETSKVRRESRVEDVEQFSYISDVLDSIDIVGVPLMPQDVMPQATLIHAVKALLENTVKPLFYSTESRAVNAAIMDLVRCVTGNDDLSEKPMAISQLSPTSPLSWTNEAAEAVIDTCRAGVPLTILPEPMSGISAPYSVAGLLTMHNTEVLCGIVLAQTVRPGTPVIYGSSWTTCDMRTMGPQIGSPETDILRIAGCQMADFYGIPSHTTAPNSDSNAHDEQNALERSLSSICAIGAGNDIVMNSGMFATGLTISLEQLVIDDEINGMINRIMRGIEVEDDDIAVECIDEVGPGGDFMMEDHTLERLYEGEFYQSSLSIALSYEKWIGQGAPEAHNHAAAAVKKILSVPNPNKLEGEAVTKMEAVIRAFEEAARS